MLASLAFCLKILDCMLVSKGGPTDKNRAYRRKIARWLVLLAYAIIAQFNPTTRRIEFFGPQNTRCGVAKNFSLDNCSIEGENNSSPHTFSSETQNYG